MIWDLMHSLNWTSNNMFMVVDCFRMLGILMPCLPVCQNTYPTTTTTTATNNNVRQFMAITMYGACSSLSADGHRLWLMPSILLIPHCFAHMRQHPTPIVTPTAAHSFIVILDSENCLLPSIPDYLHHEIADLSPANKYIFARVGCIHVSVMIQGSTYQFCLPVVLATKYTLLHIYFLHVHCLMLLVLYTAIPTNLILLLPPVAAWADSHVPPPSSLMEH